MANIMAPTVVELPGGRIANDFAMAALEKKMMFPETSSTLQKLDASKLIYRFTEKPRPVPDENMANALPETVCTDHMISCTWDATTGWAAPELMAHGPITLMPTASVLHYGTACFEGLKVYRGIDGKLRLFRPDFNARRMLMSSLRISLPAFEPIELERLIKALVAVDCPKWLPRSRPGSFLYLRPSIVGTQAQLGVQAPSKALLLITASFSPRLDSPVGGLKLQTSPDDVVRSWIGGSGYAKVGANYGPSLLATEAARQRGYGQILWLYGPERYCTEAGTTNFFLVWRARGTSELQLITAPLDDKLILDGVTRCSVLALARERLASDLVVVERRFTIDEVMEAYHDGRLVQAFVTGTNACLPENSLPHVSRLSNIQT